MAERNNEENNKTIKGTSAADSIVNSGSNVTISAGAGNDEIYNGISGERAGGHEVSIAGGTGNDTIFNNDSDVTINAGDGDDSIHTEDGNNNSINAGAGDDNIWASGHNVTVNGGTGNDYVHREWGVGMAYVYSGGNDTIEGFSTLVIADSYTSLRNEGTVTINVEGKGTITLLDYWDDNINVVSSVKDVTHYNLILNDESSKTLKGTSGVDYFWNGGSNVKINALAGNDYIDNDNSDVTIDGGAGDDDINNNGGKISINAGDGNDAINNGGNNVTINAGSGNDWVDNWNANNAVKIDLGAGDDAIGNNASDSTILGGDGHDYIDNNGGNVSINAGNGDDTISNHGGNVTIDTGEGDDNIWNEADDVTINTGAGNDNVDNNNANNAVKIDLGAGDDAVGNNASDSTIFGGDGHDNIDSHGSNVSINAGNGDDTISNHGGNVTIDTGEGDDNIWNEADDVTINTGAGNDNIDNWNAHNAVKIDAGDGDDTIGSNAFNSTLLGGDGNDVINSDADNVSINGGEGNDTIDYHGLNNTISGGTGDDYIRNDWNHNMVYVYEDGNDTIRNFRHENDYLVIEGHSWSTLRVQDDDGNNTDAVIVSVLDGKKVIGTVTLKECWSDDIYIFSSQAEVKPLNLILNGDDGASLTGTDDKDYVDSNAPNVTIKTGNGDDIIYNSNNDEWDHDELISRISPDNSLIDAGNGNNHVSNDGNNSTIKTGAGNDNVWNSGDNVLISVGAGNDYVDNYNAHNAVKIDLGAGDDNVGNNASDSTILGGTGNDFINNGGSNVSINAGAGNDTIECYGSNNTISGGSGKDYVYNNWGHGNVYVYGGGNYTINRFRPQNNFIVIEGYTWSTLRVQDDDGNDTNNVLVNVLNGKKTVGSILLEENSWDDHLNIVSSKSNVKPYNLLINDSGNGRDGASLTGTSGKDYLETDGWQNVTVKTGAGDDIINNGRGYGEYEGRMPDNAFIDAGKGNDYINNVGNNVSINAGAGSDTVWTNGDNVTVGGGAGNDYVSNGGIGLAYVYTGGNDTIDGFRSYDTLVLGKLKITSSVRADDGSNNLTLNMSNGGSIVLTGYWYSSIQTVTAASQVEQLNIIRNDSDKTVLNGTDGKDVIISTNWIDDDPSHGYYKVTINAGKGDDYIGASGRNIKVTAGDGNDTVYNWGDHVSINGGNGNDYLESYREGGDYVSINGGAGNDTIFNHGKFNTLIGGAGDDSIYNDSDNVTINSGAGNDYIRNYGNGVAYIYTGGNDTISGLDDFSAIVLGKLKINSSVHADDNSGNVTLNVSNGGTIVLTNYWRDEVNTVKSTADVEQVNRVSNDEANAELTGTSGRDLIDNGAEDVTINSGAGDDYVNNWGGSALIDAGKGDDSIWNSGFNVSIEAGKGDDSIWNYGASVSIDAGTGNDSIRNDSYGFNTTIEGGKGEDTIYVAGGSVNLKYKTGDGNDVIQMANLPLGADITLNLTDGALEETRKTPEGDIYVKVSGGTLTFKEAMASKLIVKDSTGRNVTVNAGRTAISNYINNTVISATNTAYYVNNSGDSVKVTTGNDWDYIYNTGSKVTIDSGSGKDFINNSSDNVTLNGGDGNDSIKNTSSNVTIDGGDGDDTIHSYSYIGGYWDESSGNWIETEIITPDNSTLLGGAGNDEITNSGRKVLISGGAGNDFIGNYWSGRNYWDEATNQVDIEVITPDNVTIEGGTGDDTIENGRGNNVLFKYATGDGNDSISGFRADSTLQIDGSWSTVKSGSDVIVTVGDGKITLAGAASLKTLNLVSAKPDFKTQTLTNNNKAAVTLATAYDIGDASSRTKAIKIVGNAKDNSILGGSKNDTLYGKDGNDYLNGGAGADKLYGGNGNDTFQGGAGNDTLWGQDGADVFLWSKGDGKDIIVGFDNDDMIQITSAFTTSISSAGDILLKVGSNAVLTLKQATASTFNINGDSYKISNKKLVKQ